MCKMSNGIIFILYKYQKHTMLDDQWYFQVPSRSFPKKEVISYDFYFFNFEQKTSIVIIIIDFYPFEKCPSWM